MRKVTKAGLRSRAGRAKRVVTGQLAELEHAWQHRGPRPAADFDTWLKRGAGRRLASFPDVWRPRMDIPIAEPSRVAVLLHVFYPDLVAELLEELAAIPVSFDLIATNATGEPLAIDTSVLPRVANVVILDVDNHGRDIWPMVQVVNAGLLDPYDLVLKVHTKRSAWRESHDGLAGTGSAWRREFLDSLLGSTENVTQILEEFARNPDLGVVTADGNLLGPEFWGGDHHIVNELLRRIELHPDPAELQFPAGSFYWIRGFVLQGLRALCLSAPDFELEAGQIDATTAHAIERSIGILSDEAGLRQITVSQVHRSPREETYWSRYEPDAPRSARATALPFYLPQFHAIPENDRWWGPGFTEWTNVTSASPIYRGHFQPRLPADLGFYDLRLDEVRTAQMEMASAYGISGFMYYYYWFAGRRLLSTPIEKLLASDVPKNFCLMWANENWTRRWDGRTSDVLIGQDYDVVPATEFIDDIMPFLLDDRYLRIDGRAVLAVYRIAQIPDYVSVLKHWRDKALAEGAGELAIISVDVAKEFDGLDIDIADAGLDGTLGFPPHNTRWVGATYAGLRTDPKFLGNVLSYESVVDDAQLSLHNTSPGEYPGVMVAFDNTARRGLKSDIWYGSNPYTFRRWFAAAVSAVADRAPSERLVFINAWNEWAEGAVLEPSSRFGRTYLQAVRDVLYA
jgi:lipopolysaccharide biosynthesis protein